MKYSNLNRYPSKQNTATFLEFLTKLYQLDHTKQDKELSHMIVQTITKLEQGENPQLLAVRLKPFLTPYLFKNPSNELIALHTFLDKERVSYTKYQGILSFFSQFGRR